MFYDPLFTRSQCNYCQSEISGMGIECCECTVAPHVRLCAECFSLGAEMGPHKADHRYRFFDSGSLLIFPPRKSEGSSETSETKIADDNTPGTSWSARADIRLLDAIEQYGFGNWQDISKHVESKLPSEAKDEYVSRFVTGTTGQATWRTFPFNSDYDCTNSAHIRGASVQRPIDHTLETDESPLSPSLTSKLPPLDISSDEMLQLGYMPDRDDYEKEYDNEAEKLVSQLAFNPEDDDAEIGLKLSLVDMYTRRLRERVRRKRVIRDYQLVSLFFKKDRNNKDGAVTRRRFAAYEKELTERLRHLSQFHTAREHENFIRNFIKEKELKFRIQELYKYRRNGIKTEEDCTEYEKHKLTLMRRNKLNQATTQVGSPENGSNGPTSNGPPVVPEEESLDIPVEDRSHARSFAELNDEIPVPLMMEEGAMMQMEMDLTEAIMETPMISDLLIEKDDASDASCYPVKNLILPPSFTDDFSLNYGELPSDLLSLPLIEKQPKIPEPAPPPTQTLIPPLVPENELDSQNSSPPAEKPKDMDDQSTVNICLLPSSLLLSSYEQSLCVSMNLLPSQYITIKTAMLMCPLRSCPENINDTDWHKIVTHMANNGWISLPTFGNSTCASPATEEPDSTDDGSTDDSSDLDSVETTDQAMPLASPLATEVD